MSDENEKVVQNGGTRASGSDSAMPNFDSSTGAKIGGGFIYIDESPQPYYSPNDVARRRKSAVAEESTFVDDAAKRFADNSAVSAESFAKKPADSARRDAAVNNSARLADTTKAEGGALKPKKVFLVFLSVVLLAAVVLSAALWAADFFNKEKKYKVIFLNGGAVYAEAEFKDGEGLKLPPAPEKDGYAFDGWVDKEGKIFADGAVINSDLTLNAKWTKLTVAEMRAELLAFLDQKYAETVTDAPYTEADFALVCGFYADGLSVIGGILTEDDFGAAAAVYAAAADMAAVPRAAATAGLSYTDAEGGYQVAKGTALDGADSVAVVIPEVYNGKRVVKISDFGFAEFSEVDEFARFEDYRDAAAAGKIVSVVIPDTVSAIGDFAFACGGNLTALVLPADLTEIGYGAFMFCMNIESVAVPEGVTKIGDYAFHYDILLSSLTLPDGITEIGEGAFAYDYALEEIDLPADLEKIGQRVFFDCGGLTEVIIPAGVTEIGGEAFSGCNELSIFAVSDGFAADGGFNPGNRPLYYYSQNYNMADGWYYADLENGEDPVPWANTYGLSYAAIEGGYEVSYGSAVDTDVVIPTLYKWLPVIKIADGGFSEKTNVTSVAIPGGVTEIGEYAFYDCAALTEISLPDSLTAIGNYAFAYSGLTEIDLSGTLVTGILGGAFTESALEKITLPAGLTAIGNNAFLKCVSLTAVNFSGVGLDSIGTNAFGSCSALTDIDLSGQTSLKRIDESAFYGCTSLTQIIIPESVKTISHQAFQDNPALTVFAGVSKRPPEPSQYNDWTGWWESWKDAEASVYWYSEYMMPGGWRYVIAEAGGKSVPAPWTGYGEGLAYEEVAGGYRVSIGTEIDTEAIVIPARYLGLDVVEIKEHGFEATTDYVPLKSVNIPRFIKKIGNDAFWGCPNLTAVDFSESVSLTEIGVEAFCWGLGLTAVDLSKCTSLKTIGNFAFQFCQKLTQVKLPEGLTEIGGGAFDEAGALEQIIIPASVEKISRHSFMACSKLTIFAMAAKRPDGWDNYYNPNDRPVYFYSEKSAEGCWRYVADAESGELVPVPWEVTVDLAYTEIEGGYEVACGNVSDGDIIIPELYKGLPVIKIADEGFASKWIYSVQIPASVTSIGDKAFYENYLSGITLPEGLKTIGDDAFRNCWLSSVAFPAGVETIGARAFSANPFSEVDLSNLSLTVIADGMFSNSEQLTAVILPAGVTSIGSEAFRGCYTLSEINFPSALTSIGGNAFFECKALISADLSGCTDLTAIGDNAFAYSSVNTVTFPLGLETIGDSAFNMCEVLNEVNFSALTSLKAIGNSAFASCSSLTDVVFPDSLETIGNNAFAGAGLTEVVISSVSLASIGAHAFDGCGKLTVADLSGCTDLTAIGDNAFAYSSVNTVTFPSGLETIGNMAFMECASLTAVIGDNENLRSIGNHAFDSCVLLSTFNFPKTASIGEHAFDNCPLLNADFAYVLADGATQIQYADMSKLLVLYPASKNIVVPEGITEIGDGAFASRKTFDTIELPDTLTAIGNNAFVVSGLKTISIPANVTQIKEQAFYNCTSLTKVDIAGGPSIGRNAFMGCTSLEEVNFTGNTEGLAGVSIENSAFHNCSGLKSFSIPENVTQIKEQAFANCSSLTDLNFLGAPGRLTSIGTMAFNNCGLTSVTVPGGVTSIGQSAFAYCTSLTEVNFLDGTGVTIGNSAFFSCTALTTVNIGAGASAIGDSAFSICSNLSSVTLSEGLISIGINAFRTNRIPSIIIPKSVTTIGSDILCDRPTGNLEADPPDPPAPPLTIFVAAASEPKAGWAADWNDSNNQTAGYFPVYYYSETRTDNGWKYVETDGKLIPVPWQAIAE